MMTSRISTLVGAFLLTGSACVEPDLEQELAHQEARYPAAELTFEPTSRIVATVETFSGAIKQPYFDSEGKLGASYQPPGDLPVGVLAARKNGLLVEAPNLGRHVEIGGVVVRVDWPVVALLVDSQDRVWVAVNAREELEGTLHGNVVFDRDGRFLFAVETDNVVDAFDDLIVEVASVDPLTFEVKRIEAIR